MIRLHAVFLLYTIDKIVQFRRMGESSQQALPTQSAQKSLHTTRGDRGLPLPLGLAIVPKLVVPSIVTDKDMSSDPVKLIIRNVQYLSCEAGGCDYPKISSRTLMTSGGSDVQGQAGTAVYLVIVNVMVPMALGS